jgi:hypothetical protein
MKPFQPIDTDTLIDNLALRDVPYFAGPVSDDTAMISDEALLAGLVCHEAARVRMGLIPLLLRCPEVGSKVLDISTTLHNSHVTSLQLYYTAGVILQRFYLEELQALLGLQPLLPDWFSIPLKVKGATLNEKLESVAEFHAHFTGLYLNWVGTYRHAANQFLRFLRRHQQRHVAI